MNHHGTGAALPKIGVIGVGTIAEALITGMCAFGEPRATFLLSPRNAEVANRLVRRFPAVTIADDNQAVIDDSETVILAVRPQVTEEMLSTLRFRPEQQILSLIATFSVERLAPLVAPAGAISRAIPLPPIAERRGPLTLYTQSREVVRLLDGLGRLIQVDDEAHLDLISAATSLMGTYFGMMDSVDGWLVGGGFNPAESRVFVAEMFFNLALVAKERPEESFGKLGVDYSTPGGLNEQAWQELKANGWGANVQAALDLVLDRIHGKAILATTLQKNR